MVFVALVFSLPALIIADGIEKSEKSPAVAISKKTSSSVFNKDMPIPLIGEGMMLGNQDFSANNAFLREQDFSASQSYSSLSEEGAQFAGEYGDEDVFFVSCGVNVKALRSGLIIAVGEPGKWNEGRGGYVMVEDTYYSGSVTVYSHFSEIYINEGDFVEAGDNLGLAGSSGDLLPGGSCQLGIALK